MSRIAALHPVSVIVLMVTCLLNDTAFAQRILENSVLHLNFEHEPSVSPAKLPSSFQFLDSATTGTSSDIGTLPSGAHWLPTFFTSSDRAGALLLDPAAKQVLSIAPSADLDQNGAVSISGFFANLHAANDGAMHGLLAKRQPTAPFKTNYGINYAPASDLFQLYVNDGTGFKVVIYSVRQTIGFRKRVHLTATFETADAPGADADTDKDDVKVQLFVNGIAATPARVTAGFVTEATGWLQDVKLENCLSDTPLTVGGSFADGELANIICGDLTILPTALTGEQARQLFEEVAGKQTSEIAAEQSSTASKQNAVPEIKSLSQYGLTAGQNNRLIVSGINVKTAALKLSASGCQVTSVDVGKQGQQAFDISVDPSVVPGRYLLWMISQHGVSKPVVIAIDGLPQALAAELSEANPVQQLPVAISGVISGTEQKRIHFHASAGQVISAEVEAKRLGSSLDPVVEIKTAAGAPLAVQWQQPHLAGDARATVTIPESGSYVVEVHDLQYRAPANSRFRLLLGQLSASDAAYPPALTGQTHEVRTLGTDGQGDVILLNRTEDGFSTENAAQRTPLPLIVHTTGREVNEPFDGVFEATPIDATFSVPPYAPLYLNGRISEAGQTDTIVLTVTPGQSLRFEAELSALTSALRPVLTLLSGEARAAFSDGDSGSRAPAFDYTVPESVTNLILKVNDFTDRGTPASVYRIKVARKDRPGFELRASHQSLSLPVNGAVPVRLDVIRQSPSFKYTGEIKLSTSGIDGISVVPDVIPASDADQSMFLVIARNKLASTAETSVGYGSLIIRGESVSTESSVSAVLAMDMELTGRSQTTFGTQQIPTATGQRSAATILLDTAPPVLLRGLTTAIPIRILPLEEILQPFVKFELLTTEKSRLSDPANAASAPLPMVAAPEFHFAASNQSAHELIINVPLDVAEKQIDAVIGAYFVDQPLDNMSTNTAWTAPFRLVVDDAIRLQSPNPVTAAKASTASIHASLERHPEFNEEIQIVIAGLPKDFQVMPLKLGKDVVSFDLAITIPENATSGELPGITMAAQTATGVQISPGTPLKLVIQ